MLREGECHWAAVLLSAMLCHDLSNWLLSLQTPFLRSCHLCPWLLIGLGGPWGFLDQLS